LVERLTVNQEVAGSSPAGGANKFYGAWLNLVERLLWEQEVGGSNPLAPTKNKRSRQMKEKTESTEGLFEHALKLTEMQKSIVVNALVRIETAERHLKSFEDTARFLTDSFGGSRRTSDAVEQAYSTFYTALYREIARAYGDFFMVANVFPELREVAKRAVKRKYLQKGLCIDHLLSPDGKYHQGTGDDDLKKAIASALGEEYEE
jgi:hypothetical protein